jgi:SAM-dependent methyltransferase
MWWRRSKSTDTSTMTGQGPRFRFVQKGHVLSAAAYELPHDPSEVNRQDFQHYMFRYFLRANVLAPIRSPLSILDVGSGTGRWAKEVAAQFPRSNVIGVDILPSAREQSAPNVLFMQANLLEGLPFADNTFDYVHQRVLVLGIPADQWVGAVRELVRVTQPQGWIELAEPSYGFGAPALETMYQWMGSLAKLRNIDVGAVMHLGDYLRSSRLRNIQSHRIDIPVGEHGGRVGRWIATDIQAIFQGLHDPLIGAKITTEQAYNQTVARFQSELQTQRGFIPYYVAFGQKAPYGGR